MYNLVFDVIHISYQMLVTWTSITIWTYYLRIEHFSQHTTQMFASASSQRHIHARTLKFQTVPEDNEPVFQEPSPLSLNLMKCSLLFFWSWYLLTCQFLDKILALVPFSKAFPIPLRTKTLINFIALDLKSAIPMLWNNPISA